MINRTDHGEIMHSRQVAWGKEGWMWAPVAARKDGKYYLYYPHRDVDEVWKVGEAIADSPEGPFKDTGKPVEGFTGIDALIDDSYEKKGRQDMKIMS